MFNSKWDLPPVAVIFLVMGVVVFVLLPGLKLSPLGDITGGFIALAVAFTMARRVEATQAKRRALAAAEAGAAH
jgi:hypothetical protein